MDHKEINEIIGQDDKPKSDTNQNLPTNLPQRDKIVKVSPLYYPIKAASHQSKGYIYHQVWDKG